MDLKLGWIIPNVGELKKGIVLFINEAVEMIPKGIVKRANILLVSSVAYAWTSPDTIS
jgi:hypothetical protein